MKLIVRKARPEDAEALAEVLTQAMHYKLARNDTAWDSVPYSVEELQEQIVKGNTYAVWLDGTLVATLRLLWENEMMWGDQPPIAAYAHQLAVKDGYHGHNIGSQLLDWAGQQAAAKGRKLLRIDFRPSNSSLKAYYVKHGFQFVKNRKIHAPHATYTAVLYERPTT